jgi:hypothetical protein
MIGKMVGPYEILAPIGAGENFNFPSSRHDSTIERGA